MNTTLTSEMPKRDSNDGIIEKLVEKAFKEIRADWIKKNGVDAYLESYSNYLKAQACLSDPERFEQYYQVREEVMQMNIQQ